MPVKRPGRQRRAREHEALPRLRLFDPVSIERCITEIIGPEPATPRKTRRSRPKPEGPAAGTKPRARKAPPKPPAHGIRAAVLGADFDVAASRPLWQDRSARPLHHSDPLGIYADAPVNAPPPDSGPSPFGNRRIAVYSAIVGGYDPFHTPAAPLPGVDHVVFADGPVVVPPWVSVRPIEFHSDEPTRTARYVKLHPHVLLPDYDHAIWVDANVFIAGDISDLVAAQIASGIPVGAIAHPERHSVYQEAAACLGYRKDDAEALREQVRRYDRLDFDCDDLIESNFMMFDLRHPAMSRFLATWWSELERHTYRDQLSVNFALRENRLSWRPLIEAPHSMRSHPKFVLLPHGEEARDIAERRARAAGGDRPVRPAGRPATFRETKALRMVAQRHREIDVIVCVKDALEHVERCLESVLSAEGSARRRVILVDDGSAAPTRDYLASLAAGRKDVVLRRNETSRGYTRAANQGLAEAGGDLVILLNSDTIVSNWWVEKLADALFTTPGAGLVGPMSNAASQQSLPSILGIDGQTAINPLPPGETPADLDRLCEEWAGREIFPRVPLVHGFCFGISREVIERIGWFDDHSFPNAYGEENDYCFRATDAGFDAVIATSAYVFHAKTQSYTSAERSALAHAARATVHRLYGRERLRRAVDTMKGNPVLVNMRRQAEAHYASRALPAEA